MLKKLLTGCLTIAMIGAFSSSAVAENTYTWTGNVTGSLTQTTTKAGVADAKSITDLGMAASGDLDLAVAKSGDSWTGTAFFELDWDNAAVSVDDLYATMENDQLAIMIGANDIVGIGQGKKYLGEVDDTYGAGGNLMTPNEQGWLQLSLKEVGLDLFIGMNESTYEYEAAGTSAVTFAAKNFFNDASTDGTYNSTAYGLTFKKTINIVDLGFQYVTMGTTVDENDSADSTKDGAFDGLAASEMSLAVTANFNEQMALTLNYASSAFTSGVASAKENTLQTMELAFDFGISDTMGLTAVYGTYAYDTGVSGDGNKYDGTEMNVTFNLKTDGIDHYVAYQTRTLKSDATDAKEASEAKVGYALKVAF